MKRLAIALAFGAALAPGAHALEYNPLRPPGEAITCAKSFCRRRRCMLAEGGLRII